MKKTLLLLSLFTLAFSLMSQKAQIDLPINWDDTTNIDFSVIDFGGDSSLLDADPTNPSNIVLKTIKTSGSQTWAGTVLGSDSLATAIPFSAGNTLMRAVVYSPDANIPVRLKVENEGNSSISVETEAMTTVANQWDTLTFDFSNNVAGTPAINFSNVYDKIAIFYDFGTMGSGKTYYVDLVEFFPSSSKAPISLPITWDDTATVNYNPIDFGGNASAFGSDPTNPSNIVLTSTKVSGAQIWAGTSFGNNLAAAIPFSANNTTIRAAVYSPDANTPIRIKVEDQTNPAISVEVEVMTTVANTWDTLSFDFSNHVSGTSPLVLSNTYDKISIFYDFGTMGSGKIYHVDLVEFIGAPAKAQIDLPITWEDSNTVNYDYVDFGGNASALAADPNDPNNTVLMSTKTSGAQTWAGTSLGNALASAIPFVSGSTVMRAIVYSPDANIPVRLKVEDQTNPGISVETEAMTTVANQWDTLTFDFANHVSGTAAINFANTYDKASIFYDFNTMGSGKVYYVDDVWFGSNSGGGGGTTKAQIDLPITWNDTAMINYDYVDFGGNASALAADPTNASNIVLMSTKTSGSQIWAGTSLGNALATAIPFVSGSTVMRAIVYSPDANIPVRLKVEDQTNPGISVETEAMTTVANQWDTLVFDFSNHVSGTAAINFANTYDKASIFYDFGTMGSGKVYYVDDVWFGGNSGGGGGPMKAQIDLPINWNDTANINHDFVDFGGNASMLAADPNNASNIVLQSTKTSGSQIWAGTSLGNALATAIPFSAGNTIVTAVVYSPDANIPVRIKVEDQTNPGISVETEAMTTVANQWDTLTFNFTNHVSGTAAINFANTYDKMSIFYDFGTMGSGKVYYVDDVAFGPIITSINQIEWKQDLSIYPNPANQFINLVSNDGQDTNVELEIFNTTGQLVRHQLVNLSIQSRIDVSDIQNGLYTIRIRTARGMDTYKILISH